MSNAIEEIKFVGLAAVEQLISNFEDALDNKQPKGNYLTDADRETLLNEVRDSSKFLIVTVDEEMNPSHSAEEILAAVAEGKHPVLKYGSALLTTFMPSEDSLHVDFFGLLTLPGAEENQIDAGKVKLSIGQLDEPIEEYIETFGSGSLVGTTDDITPRQVYEAIVAGQSIMISHPTDQFGTLVFTSFAIAGDGSIVGSSYTVDVIGELINASLTGYVPNDLWQCSTPTLTTRDNLSEAVDAALEQAKESGKFEGPRGPGILRMRRAPDFVETEIDGITFSFKMDISLIILDSAADEVMVGDLLWYNNSLYHIGHLDSTYAYIDSYWTLRGEAGYTPVKGTDYFTEADKTEMVNSVLAELPTWTGGSY